MGKSLWARAPFVMLILQRLPLTPHLENVSGNRSQIQLQLQLQLQFQLQFQFQFQLLLWDFCYFYENLVTAAFVSNDFLC